MRRHRPVGNGVRQDVQASEGKSRLQRWFGSCRIAIGACAPSARLRPPRRRTCGRSSRQRRRLGEPLFEPAGSSNQSRPGSWRPRPAEQRSQSVQSCSRRSVALTTSASASRSGTAAPDNEVKPSCRMDWSSWRPSPALACKRSRRLWADSCPPWASSPPCCLSLRLSPSYPPVVVCSGIAFPTAFFQPRTPIGMDPIRRLLPAAPSMTASEAGPSGRPTPARWRRAERFGPRIPVVPHRGNGYSGYAAPGAGTDVSPFFSRLMGHSRTLHLMYCWGASGAGERRGSGRRRPELAHIGPSVVMLTKISADRCDRVLSIDPLKDCSVSSALNGRCRRKVCGLTLCAAIRQSSAASSSLNQAASSTISAATGQAETRMSCPIAAEPHPKAMNTTVVHQGQA